MNRYQVIYRLGFAPWERRDVSETWRRVVEGPDASTPGRALDIGCGRGRDAVYLAKHGWRVTAVDFVAQALANARERAAQEGADVQFVQGDVGNLVGLGLEPGYSLLYDFGCIHGLPDAARAGAFAGLKHLAAPGSTLLVLAFMRGPRLLLPRGMDREEIVSGLGDAFELVGTDSMVDPSMPPPVRRAKPTLYRLMRKG